MIADLKRSVETYLKGRSEREGAFQTAAPGLVLTRTETPVLPTYLLYKPVLAVVLQGAKQVAVGDSLFHYAAGQALLVGVDIPAFGSVTAANVVKPYLGMTLELDFTAMREMAKGSTQPATMGADGVFVYDCSAQVIDCLTRLVQLLETPDAIPSVQPLIVRELCYWMLAGPQGRDVRGLVMSKTAAPRLFEAVHTLRENYQRPVRINDLADAAAMSPSSFYSRFKALTTLTPLQYQKQMRLAEARYLLNDDEPNVAAVAYQVGYESVSQFHREYKRAFGRSPRDDARPKIS